MPHTSLDAYLSAQLRTGSAQTTAAKKAPCVSSVTRDTAAHAAGPWSPEVDSIAHETKRACDVLLVVGPGVYHAKKWWVRPLSRSCSGWLAAEGDLMPVTRRPS